MQTESCLIGSIQRCLCACALWTLLANAPAAEPGWPLYRADAQRSGYTPAALPEKPALRWVHQPAQPPARAWPGEPRLEFDAAHHVVSDGASVYFGTSADGKICALDAGSGRLRWTFYTGGPVRFAPALWQNLVIAASDDGWLYALKATDGQVAWKRRLAPSDRLILGNGRMISKWPVRGGPVVAGDTIYAGAGIWPTDGVYLYALNAADGVPVWTNADSGGLKMNQPHGASAQSGISIQGYLAVSGDRLLVPAGRGPYSSFLRSNGTYQYHHLGAGWSYGSYGATIGGSQVIAVDDLVIHGTQYICKVNDGLGNRVKDAGLDAAAVAATPKYICYWNGKALAALDRAEPLAASDAKLKKEETLKIAWTVEAPAGPRTALIVAGDTALLGGENNVLAIDLQTKRMLCDLQVEGMVHGLAVAGGRLFVSTGNGHIYCFGAGGEAAAASAPKPNADPYGSDAVAAAEAILKLGGLTEGYALDLGCGDGRLLYALAKRSNLRLIGLERDPALVAQAREKLDAAGLLGTRVTILQGDPDQPALPNHFANLVVSNRNLNGGAAPAQDAMRCLRPFGGVACLGKAGTLAKTVRGPLEGAGAWTHQYADAGQTSCSSDAVLKGSLTMLWFGGDNPAQVVPSRHGRSPAPLFSQGLYFVLGIDDVCAFDAYNGRQVWRLPLPEIGKRWHSMPKVAGVAASGSNFCTDGRYVYVANGADCLRIDAQTGAPAPAYKAPQGKWSFLACANGVLVGSVADESVLLSGGHPGYAKALFALNAESGKVLWQLAAKDAFRVNAIATDGKTVYAIDRSIAPADRAGAVKGKPAPDHPGGTLLALDAATGRELWRQADGVFGTMLVLDAARGVLLQCYLTGQYLGLPSEVGGRLAAFRAADGKRMYDVKADYGLRPVVVDGTIIGGAGAWDLMTGEVKNAKLFARSYGCGAVSAGRHLLAFRSGCIGYFDLARNAGTESFGGIRPGCWLNLVPAGGLLLAPDYSQFCSCSYQMKVSLALEPAAK